MKGLTGFKVAGAAAVVAAGLAGWAAITPAAAQTAQPQMAQAEAPAAKAPDRVLGNPDAPVTIIEYSSLTCPHCAAFHRDTLPQVKAEWIDTGRAKLVYRDFPLDGLALAGAMLAHCAGDNRYFPFLETLFQTQSQWSRAPEPAAALRNVARLGGMSEQQFDSCLQDQELMTAIQARRDIGASEHSVNSTPTFIINGRRVTGALPYDQFQKVLEEAAAR
ncbi:DsbA family protein [Telmatospirillum sp. J64-1]|uniref:DsbA family protein n=1 Tax=Telmatospirillum sp. J64-1 TaxID=2502183 RepID=UPI001C8F8C05|nr:DsbA family protein [Telmatospirillum sp. J64-1]